VSGDAVERILSIMQGAFQRLTILALPTLVAVFALAGCGTAPPRGADTGASSAGDNSRNALDWQGVYVGTIPCADCPGIRVRIELRDDGRFTRAWTYLERNVAPLTDTGRFEWDSAGARIRLMSAERAAQQYQVGENVLFALDRNGQRITGERADLYRLEQVVNDARIENRRWRLIELNGRAVEPPAEREGVYFELDGAQARVTGNASCNRFSGTYALTAGGRLQFDPNLITTRMACDAIELEREVLEVLPRVDNYTLADGVLSLNRARMAPLARFRAQD